MKKLFYALILFCLVFPVSGQNLSELYKNGKIKLLADTNYAQNNNWENVFKTYYDTIYGKPMGNRKSLIIMPDGSIVVNHAYRNFYSKFNPEGSFQNEFGIKKGNQILKKTKKISGIINQNTFFTSLDNMGNMLCFDFDGNYKKTLKLDYMTHQMISLPNGKIAVVGWVIWKDKFRDFVSIVDYNTNDEKVIWEHFTDRNASEKNDDLFNYIYSFEKRGMVSCSTMPFTKNTGMKAYPQLASVNNQLIIANPTDGEIQVFDLEGTLISKKQLKLTKNNISVEEQKEIQQKAIANYKNMNPLRFVSKNWVGEQESKKVHHYFIEAMENDLNKIVNPISKPAFSTVIQDSDENLLFFEFAEEIDANKFNVWIYKNQGELICQSSFICDDYKLQINPEKMVFYNGYIYSLQNKKNVNGVPLRLIRFKLSN